jgi:hypothetical protein
VTHRLLHECCRLALCKPGCDTAVARVVDTDLRNLGALYGCRERPTIEVGTYSLLKFHAFLGSRAAESGTGDDRESTLPLGCETETGADILARKLREIGQDLILAHAAGEVREHVANRNARPTHSWLSEADLGVKDDAFAVVHAEHYARLRRVVKRW